MKINLFILTICISLLTSCKEVVVPEKINRILILAGDNKNEILKTIKHFQYCGDSLKLKAAYFLIENLENKYSYTGESYNHLQSLIGSYCLDTIKNKASKKIVEDKIEKELSYYSNIEYSKIEDVKYVSSEFLIDYIKDSFKAWEMPWIKGKINYEQFCEYILPYKVGDEPIENWRASVLQDYKWLIDSLAQTHADLLEAAKIINNEVSKQFKPHGASNISLNFGYNNLKKIRTGSCYHAAAFTMYIMRALGVPISMDITPLWGNRNSGHQWTAIHLLDGSIVPFDPTYNFERYYDRFNPKKNRTDPPPEYAVSAKIFRVSFSVQKNKYTVQEDIPPLFKKNLIDITDQYTLTTDINMRLQNVPEGSNYGYLFVFTVSNWMPIQISGVDSARNISFKKMGKGVVYLPGFLSSEELLPFDYPFVQTEKGQTKKFRPQREKSIPAIIYRKYPLTERMISYADRMRGGTFQVSNSPTFTNPTILYKITKTPEPYFQEVVFKIKGSYRYFRYSLPDSCHGNVAEIEVYTNLSKEPVYGKFIGTGGMSQSYRIEKAFDQNSLSYYDAFKDTNCWIGIDFGEKIKISKIRYLPRNDQNTIEPGDDYELFYWDNKWISLGVQTAEKHFLKYSVPENALLWLRNLTKGKEERIFTYEHGKQIWR